MTEAADDVEKFFSFRVAGHYRPEADIFDDLLVAAKHITRIIDTCLPAYEVSVVVTDENGCEVTW